MRTLLFLALLSATVTDAAIKVFAPITVQSVEIKNNKILVNIDAITTVITRDLFSHINLRRKEGKGQGKGQGKGGKGGQGGGDCPILNLELDPIVLDLLGLRVTTSAICLAVTAHEGEGLVGDLLCDLANALEDGGLLGFLNGLTQADRNTLLMTLKNLLSHALGLATTTGGTNTAVSSLLALRQSCPILRLSLGPLDLTLLGLEVHLDNCANGPVRVDITGESGQLLGDLLCQVAGLGLTLPQLENLLANVLGLLRGSQIDVLLNLLALINLPGGLTLAAIANLILAPSNATGGLVLPLLGLGGGAGLLAAGGGAMYAVRRKRNKRNDNTVQNTPEPLPMKDVTVDA